MSGQAPGGQGPRNQGSGGQGPAGQVDVRGPRFAAAVTAVVLAVTVLTGSVWLLLAQAIVFAIGAAAGVQAAPYGVLFRRLVRPRLGPATAWEDPQPPRFAQFVGRLVTGIGLILAAAGVSGAVVIFAGLALVAAVLNAAFGLCLGCELYLLGVRMRARA